MCAIRGVKDRRFKFVQLLNSMFEDQNISLKAKGFIGFCLTNKEDWDFHISHLAKKLKEGERAIYSTIDELEEWGYAIRYQPHKKNGEFGTWETIVSDSKDEIALIKEELKDDPDFQKSFTDRRFAHAQAADAQSVPHNNTNINNTKTTTTPPDEPVEKTESEKVVKKVVVVSSDEEKKVGMLAPYGLPPAKVEFYCRQDIEVLKNAVDAVEQYRSKNDVASIEGLLHDAITGKWKPKTESKVVPIQKQNDDEVERLNRIYLHKKIAEQAENKYRRHCAILSSEKQNEMPRIHLRVDHVLVSESRDDKTIESKLSYENVNFIGLLNNFLKKYGLSKT